MAERSIIFIRAGKNYFDKNKICEEENCHKCEEEICFDEPRENARRLKLMLSRNSLELSAIYSSCDLNNFILGSACHRELGCKKFSATKELKEIDFGLCKGLSSELVEKHYPAVYKYFDGDGAFCDIKDLIYPNGESLTRAFNRIKGILNLILKEHREGNILMVAPQGVISLGIVFLLKERLSVLPINFPATEPFTASIVKRINGEYKLENYGLTY